METVIIGVLALLFRFNQPRFHVFELFCRVLLPVTRLILLELR